MMIGARLWLGVMGLLLAGCGGRSAIGSYAPGRTDGGWLDGWPSASDGRPFKKDTRPKKWDGPIRKDHAVVLPDLGCLPIASGQVIGLYKGAWKGTLSCPGLPQQMMSGTLSLTVAKVSGSATLFGVKGSLEGALDAVGLPIAGSFSGTMSCTSLSATLPSVTIGSGAIVYKLQGGLAATFDKTGSGTGWGFPGGTLDINDPNLGCIASLMNRWVLITFLRFSSGPAFTSTACSRIFWKLSRPLRCNITSRFSLLVK